jgi:hypothetical protein
MLHSKEELEHRHLSLPCEIFADRNKPVFGDTLTHAEIQRLHVHILTNIST